jgi:hypothetical protein
LRITLDKTNPRAFDEFLAAARDVPEVMEIQTFLGRVDLRLAVIARSMSHYQEIYRDRILTLPHIADIEALMHVATDQEPTDGAGMMIDLDATDRAILRGCSRMRLKPPPNLAAAWVCRNRPLAAHQAVDRGRCDGRALVWISTSRRWASA